MNAKLTIAVLVAISILVSCHTSGKGGALSVANDSVAADTLTVGTLYGPTTFFILRGDTMGYEYERARNFAKSQGMNIRFTVKNSLGALIAMLDSGKIDLVAYEVPITHEYNRQVRHCGSQSVTYQVLVQPLDDERISDVTELVGKDIYVEKGSKYESRLRNLDDEIGGGIHILTLQGDSLSAEDLIDKVATGEIPYTVVNSDIAKLNKTYYDNIDISVNISFPQRSSWSVSKDNSALADSIDSWSTSVTSDESYKGVLRRYFEMSKNGVSGESDVKAIASVKHGIISQYDIMFRRHAASQKLDWRLLAAVGWVESQFHPKEVSWAGARGLMQLMPRTARAYGLTDVTIDEPESNIIAAAKYIVHLDKTFRKTIPSREERQKVVLAAYNAGVGHVLDAIALAKKHGKDPQRWNGNIEEALLWKSNPLFYNDDVCKSGYFRGRQTVAYVNHVTRVYDLYCNKIKK